MDCQIDRSCEQRLFNFLGEHSLGSDGSKGDVLHAVTGGANNLDLNLVPQLAQGICNVVCLP
jgi:hypothetical protein